MKQFILGVVTGVVGDRILVNGGLNNTELITELRRQVKKLNERIEKLDETLAEKETQAAAQDSTPKPSETEVPIP